MVRYLAIALLCGLLAVGERPALAGDAPAGPPPLAGLDYCQDLASRVENAAERQPDKSADVADLIREGKAQCASGHVRSGLHRLRIALVALGGG